MKSFFYLLLLCGLTFVHQSFAQLPVGFPDGITVGTGVTIPTGSTYKMAISGGIITEKVRVATNGTTFWADFVFDPSYQLRPLAEVEKYIKTNQHLPEIPSTADVTKNGIDLAETQALLLQKVEELTLYVIEQNKKIEKLEKKVKRLSRKH
ncbi:MAG: hypothetical protein V4585_09920 [Bacteroidota bacterium]|jgi:hypothetical protein